MVKQNEHEELSNMKSSTLFANEQKNESQRVSRLTGRFSRSNTTNRILCVNKLDKSVI